MFVFEWELFIKKSHLKRKLTNALKPNWLAKCFVITEKKFLWRTKEEWKHEQEYDPKRPQGHYRSLWPTLWPQRSRWPLLSVWPTLWSQKVTWLFKIALTFFMTPKVTVTFVVSLTKFMTPKGHGVTRSRHDLLYDSEGHGHLSGRFDQLQVYDAKRSRARGH